MKKNITFLIATMLSIGLMAQPQLEWAKNYGGFIADGSYSIVTDNEGNVYTAGYIMDSVNINTLSGPLDLFTVGGSADVMVTKQDADGNFIWAKQMGGPMGENAYSCAVDNSGNVYVTGVFLDTADFDPGSGIYELTSAGGFDIFICKLSSAGDFLWAKQIGGEGDADYGQYLALDPADGSIYITGMFNGPADFNPGSGVHMLYPAYAGDYDSYILKLDADGNFIWAKSITGNQFDTGTGLAADGNGNLYISGVFSGETDFDPGEGEFILSSNNYGYTDGYVCKFNATDGRFIWAIQVGGPGNDWANSIALDPAGNLLVTGEYYGDVDFDPGIEEFIVPGIGGYDIFVWKLDADGKLIWAKGFGGPDYEWGASIAVDGSGNAYTTGHFMTTADFDPGTGVYNLTAGAYHEVFISKLTSAGEFAWAMAFKGNQYYDLNIDDGTCIAVDADNNVYTTGSFESWVDVDPSPAIFYITAHDIPQSGMYFPDAFIHKLSQTTVGIPQLGATTFSLYPNPVKDLLTIDLGAEYSYLEAKIIDLTGKTLSTNIFNATSTVNLKMDVAPGIYLLQLKDKTGVIANLKVVKE